jgi:hypothetical protein
MWYCDIFRKNILSLIWVPIMKLKKNLAIFCSCRGATSKIFCSISYFDFDPGTDIPNLLKFLGDGSIFCCYEVTLEVPWWGPVTRKTMSRPPVSRRERGWEWSISQSCLCEEALIKVPTAQCLESFQGGEHICVLEGHPASQAEKLLDPGSNQNLLYELLHLAINLHPLSYPNG